MGQMFGGNADAIVSDFYQYIFVHIVKTDFGRTIGEHASAPLVWLETTKSAASKGGGGGDNDDKEYTALGGRDMFCQWAEKTFPDDAEIQNLLTPPTLSELFFDNKTPGGTYAAKK